MEIIQKFRNQIIILSFTLLLQLPFFLNPSLVLNRGNDLQEFFWPIIEFTKKQILTNGSIPLWYNSILSGTPLLPDPQSMIFYLPNIIFLFLPMGQAFIVSVFFHTALGGLGIYFLTKRLFPSLLYVSAPALAGFIEAGHFGLVTSWAWMPFALYFFLKRNLLAAFFLALIFYSHVLIFVITLGVFTAISIYKHLGVKYAASVYLFTFGLTAIVLLPMLEWSRNTNRFLLLDNPEVFPVWQGLTESLKILFAPWTGTDIQRIRTDKWIALGVGLPTLSFLGFIGLGRRERFIIGAGALAVGLVVLNNLSPIEPIFLDIDAFKLLRVTTRLWPVVVIPMIFLATKAASKHKTLAAFTLLEFTLLWFVYIDKPPSPRPLAPRSIINFLKQDGDRFRVYCLTRCISQRDAVKNDLELIDGYSTLTQTNYYKHSWQLTGGFWDYYSLSTPPIGLYKDGKVHPNYESLGQFGTKYIISQNPLEEETLKGVFRDDGYIVYENLAFQARTNAKIISHSPNKIVLDTNDLEGNTILLSEVYSDGWKAYANPPAGGELAIAQTPEAQRAINITTGTNFVELTYSPDSYEIGRAITLLTIGLILIFFILRLLPKIPPRLLIAGISIALSILLVELALRGFYKTTTLVWSDDPVVGRRLVADQQGLFIPQSREYETKIKINSQGWRDSEHSFGKPKGDLRVLIVGDSFVENFQVPLEETFFKQLEQRLGIEVVAMGLGDTGTAQQLILLEEYAADYDPDIILHLFFTGNDVKNNSRKLNGDPHRPYFEINSRKLQKIPFSTRGSTPTGRLKSWAKNNIKVAKLAFDVKGKLDQENVTAGDYPVDYHVYDKNYTKEYSKAWEVTKRLIIKSKNEAERMGANYMLVSLANNEQVNPAVWRGLIAEFPGLKEVDRNRPDTILKNFCEENSINCHFMLPFFQEFGKASPNVPTHYPLDGHWNDTGTNLATEFLTNLLPKPTHK